jgi:hypothetical protein
MNRNDRPGGLVYLIIIGVAVLVAWVFIRPLGLQIHDIFQTLVDAFNNR